MTLTALDMGKNIGLTVHYQVNGLEISCIIENVKQSYGALRYQVKPVVGSGRIWVDASSIVF